MSPPRPSFVPIADLLRRPGHSEPLARRLTVAGGPDPGRGEYVLYWMQASRRLAANLALDHAVALGNELGLPVVVYESLRPDSPAANDRIHRFVLDGVAGARAEAARRGLRYVFFLPRTPDDARGVLRRLARRARVVVTDEYPTGVPRGQTARFARACPVPLHLVDGNGVLPMRAADHEMATALAFRFHLHRALPAAWSAPRDLAARLPPFAGELEVEGWDGTSVDAAIAACAIDHEVPPVDLRGGREAALAALAGFAAGGLRRYEVDRGRSPRGPSGLSPYLHFGFLGAHELVRAVVASDAPPAAVDAFLEQAVVRRELSFNLCFHRPDHASLSALPAWARATLDAHRADRRESLYDHAAIESAATHDEVWNLAQRQLLATGGIHNTLRMIWGKKLLEWSATPEEAHRRALALHDRWALDGRDPNTHAGVLWCLGKHDRPFFERAIYGTVRYMSSARTAEKIDLAAVRREVEAASPGRVHEPAAAAQGRLW